MAISERCASLAGSFTSFSSDAKPLYYPHEEIDFFLQHNPDPSTAWDAARAVFNNEVRTYAHRREGRVFDIYYRPVDPAAWKAAGLESMRLRTFGGIRAVLSLARAANDPPTMEHLLVVECPAIEGVTSADQLASTTLATYMGEKFSARLGFSVEKLRLKFNVGAPTEDNGRLGGEFVSVCVDQILTISEFNAHRTVLPLDRVLPSPLIVEFEHTPSMNPEIVADYRSKFIRMLESSFKLTPKARRKVRFVIDFLDG